MITAWGAAGSPATSRAKKIIAQNFFFSEVQQ
jgi:hypothetical protein